MYKRQIQYYYKHTNLPCYYCIVNRNYDREPTLTAEKKSALNNSVARERDVYKRQNIFREPITKCVNNFESVGWEALEELKEDVSYLPFIRIIESMQAAVEKIPIQDAFDELDSERAYYQEKRKESNERLISKKGLIGKAMGFAPMICMFVGYLICLLYTSRCV